ncbi:MAG: hypothetical protein F6K37_40685 [Moorea sp. SIO4E2]|uniref:hypothetical protein n=1 Tax=Moorena sp. SIO4E2 TaxID=2607826 RepID=UPI0010555673|nr:hypothetical protein [Moorena sp. SIO4E2]NEQ11956.1 hypothetical protein [Moorena sp. SIO4E2]
MFYCVCHDLFILNYFRFSLSYQLSAISYQLSAISYQLSFISHQPLALALGVGHATGMAHG